MHGRIQPLEHSLHSRAIVVMAVAELLVADAPGGGGGGGGGDDVDDISGDGGAIRNTYMSLYACYSYHYTHAILTIRMLHSPLYAYYTHQMITDGWLRSRRTRISASSGWLAR
jgi:hypothetical protein